MKKKLFVVALSVVMLPSFAQKIKESEVPKKVQDGLKSVYADATAVKWEKEGANYEAEFKADGLEQSALLDINGSVLESEVKAGVSDLPAAAKSYIETNHKKARIREVSKVTDPTGVMYFKAEVAGRDLIFDSDGNFLREEAEDDKN